MSIDFALTGVPAVCFPFPLVVDLAVLLDFGFELPPTIAFSLSCFRDLLGISVDSDANVLGDPSHLTIFWKEDRKKYKTQNKWHSDGGDWDGSIHANESIGNLYSPFSPKCDRHVIVTLFFFFRK